MRTLEILPEDGLEVLWERAAKGEQFDRVLVSRARRTGSQLYAILASVAPLVKVGGKIEIQPFADSLGGETRVEATDVFLAVHRQWERHLVAGQVLELVLADYSKANSLLPPTPSGKKVISYALFGDCRLAPEESQHRLAEEHLAVLVRAHHALFPGWELRIHHDEAIYASNYGAVLKGLERQELVKLVYVPSRTGQGKCERMMHRLMPAWDPEVAFVFCRDVDSLPTWRERCADEEFMTSGAQMGTIHDDPMHVGIMGGLCHVDAKKFKERTGCVTFDEFVAAFNFDDAKWAQHGSDQEALNKIAGWMPSVLEHQLFKVRGENGEILRRPAERSNVKVVYEIAPFDDLNVAEIVKSQSDKYANYIGSAGYKHEESLAFYKRRVSSKLFAIEDLEAEDRYFHRREVRPIIGLDDNPDYYFYLSIISVAWRDRLGYKPLVLLVGTPDHWLLDPKRKLAVDRAREVGAEIHFIGDYPGVRTSTVAQVSRLFASFLPTVDDNEYLLTTDADMLPLGEWIGHGRGDADVDVFFANAYANEGKIHYPMCYIGAKAKTWWNEIVNDKGSLHTLVTKALVDAPTDADGAWNYDEYLLTKKLTVWHKYPENCNLVDRNFIKGEWRIDRADWDRGLEAALTDKLEGAADAHLIRPGYTEENWPRVKPLLDAALDPDVVRWLDDYHTEYLALENT